MEDDYSRFPSLPPAPVQVVTNDERRPVLYDAFGRPLVRQVGFQKEH